MRVLTVVLGLAACLSLGLVSGTAQANSVGIEQVRQMAFDHGIVRLDEIELRKLGAEVVVLTGSASTVRDAIRRLVR